MMFDSVTFLHQLCIVPFHILGCFRNTGYTNEWVSEWMNWQSRVLFKCASSCFVPESFVRKYHLNFAPWKKWRPVMCKAFQVGIKAYFSQSHHKVFSNWLKAWKAFDQTRVSENWGLKLKHCFSLNCLPICKWMVQYVLCPLQKSVSNK